MLRLLSQPLAPILCLALAAPVFASVRDPVGNRTQLASTLAPVPAALWNYDANDRFAVGDTYDGHGSVRALTDPTRALVSLAVVLPLPCP
ncbi:MAG: hypothetical protein ACYDCG_11695 [Candidatus Acidiferrales bacterium]